MRSCSAASIVRSLHIDAMDTVIDHEFSKMLAHLKRLQTFDYSLIYNSPQLEEQVEVEKTRLALMKFICKKMTDNFASKDEQIICAAKIKAEAQSEAKEAKMKMWWRKLIFGIFTLGGFVNNVLTEFFGFKDMMLAMFTGLASPVSATLSAVFTFINASLYVASDSSLLGRFFGIKFAAKRRELLEHINSQIEVNNDINLVLRDCYKNIPLEQRGYYGEAIKNFNHHIEHQKATFKTPDYTTRKQVCSVLIAIGYVLTIGAAGFFAFALFPYLGITALLSVGGMAIMALAIGTNLFSFYNYQARAIKAIAMPAKNEEKQLEAALPKTRTLSDRLIDTFCHISEQNEFTMQTTSVNPQCGLSQQPQLREDDDLALRVERKLF